MIYPNHTLDSDNLNKLKKFKKSDRIPHAFLFHGVEGAGKEFTAIEFAAYINCESNAENLACRKCHSCLKLLSNNHDLIHYIFPMPRGKIKSKKDGIEKSLNENTATEFKINLQKKIENPYHDIKLNGANTILINSIREIKKTIFRTSENNSYRVILIFNAEMLCFPNNESANSLLKILEEPPNKSIIILITSKSDLLIDTVKSRCLDIYFSRPSIQTFNNYNKNNNYKTIDLYRLVNGNIKLLMKIKEKDLIDLEKFYTKYKKFIINDTYEIDLNMLDYIAKAHKYNSNFFRLIILSMKSIYRDAVNFKYRKNYKPIFSSFDSEVVKKIDTLDFDFIDKITEFEKDILINVNLELSVVNLLLSLKQKK